MITKDTQSVYMPSTVLSMRNNFMGFGDEMGTTLLHINTMSHD